MTVIVGILALIGLTVVGAIGWAFAQGVARWPGNVAGSAAWQAERVGARG